MTGRAFQAVLFDLDDTLHDDTATYRMASRRVAEDIARKRDISAADLYGEYNRIAEGFWSDLRVEHLGEGLNFKNLRAKLWGQALATVGIDDETLAQHAATEYNRFRADGLQLFPGVLPLLAGLRAAGRRTGLITNGFAETHREKIALLRLESAFDDVIMADEVGMVKPDPRIFVHACERLGAEPQQSVMVGDRYDRDIAGAAEAGLATIWLKVRGESFPADKPAPDAIVSTFEEVCALLGPSLEPSKPSPASASRT
ncbi:MAG: HAD-IA family hydrolase [Candidatus Eremiobacteraeota bacterium]|nr:HAD-IA family hydrolase [Candidatus Eremiobacteraeota bacterium]